MSTLYGDNVTKLLAGTGGDNWVDQGVLKAGLQVFTDDYECVTVAADSTIQIAELPEGANIMDIVIITDDLGTGLTVSVGDAESADRYIAAATVSTTGGVVLRLNQIAGLGYVTGTGTDDTGILITTIGAAANGTIKSKVVYTLGN